MKAMKKFILMTAAVALIACGLTACMDSDDYGLPGKWVSFGEVTKTSNLMVEEILADNGDVLVVTSNMIPQYEMKVGDRVQINYSITGNLPATDSRKGSQIKLYLARLILSKGPIEESFILEDEQHRNDSIGNDPVGVEYAWFGGKYLNLCITMMRSDPDKMHMINIVHDDTDAEDATVYLTLRHNAKGDHPSYPSYGLVSFDLSGLMPEGAKQIYIKLQWTDLNGTEQSDEGVFMPYESSGNAPNSLRDNYTSVE